MPKYYAVKKGRQSGIYNSWDNCREQVNGFSNAKYKSFNSAQEANDYMNDTNGSQISFQSHHSSGGSGSGSSRSDNRPVVYTDGACRNNGFGGAKAGIGVHWPQHSHYDISEPLEGKPTNNRAEIRAATRAVEQAKEMGYKSLELNTDSQFLIKSKTEWINKWKQNNWKTSDGRDVINKDDFKALEKASEGMDIRWKKVAAHTGVPGNERADRLANEAIDKHKAQH